MRLHRFEPAAAGENGCIDSLPSSEMNRVVTRYTIAFLKKHLLDSSAYDSILTASYAATHQPAVQFVTSEKCEASRPDDSYFSYVAEPGECRVEKKDPFDEFVPALVL